LRNNDQPQAVKFYAKEMEFYRKLVKGNKSYSWSDRATLWFNKRTNNFGLSFWKPLRLLLLLSIVFYFFVLPFIFSLLLSLFANSIRLGAI
jgi:hypothetical protein